MPKVSIILTTHGPAPYLKQAIGSVLAQTFEDWECWISVDRGEYQSRVARGLDLLFEDKLDNRFKVCTRTVPNSTTCRFAYTINAAFPETKGDLITYLCHDDLYLPWRLEQMEYWLDINRDWDVVFGHQRLINEESSRFSIDGHEIPGQIRKGNPDQPAGTVDHSSVMHRRECFEKAGGWDENAEPRYGDAYFWLRLQNAGYRFHCIPEVLDVHRFNTHSITYQIERAQQQDGIQSTAK